jgi:hypothetical protein
MNGNYFKLNVSCAIDSVLVNLRVAERLSGNRSRVIDYTEMLFILAFLKPGVWLCDRETVSIRILE